VLGTRELQTFNGVTLVQPGSGDDVGGLKEVIREKKELGGEGVNWKQPGVPDLYSLRDRKVLLAARTGVVSDPFHELVMAGGEDIVQRGCMTNRDTKVFRGANDLHVRPSHAVQSSTELGATTGGNKDGFGSIQLKASGFGKDIEALLDRRKVGNKILSTNGNVISIKTDVNLGGARDHVVQNIHKKDKESGRERATLFDTSMEVNTKGI
jgi:hypothetical protein